MEINENGIARSRFGDDGGEGTCYFVRPECPLKHADDARFRPHYCLDPINSNRLICSDYSIRMHRNINITPVQIAAVATGIIVDSFKVFKQKLVLRVESRHALRGGRGHVTPEAL